MQISKITCLIRIVKVVISGILILCVFLILLMRRLFLIHYVKFDIL